MKLFFTKLFNKQYRLNKIFLCIQFNLFRFLGAAAATIIAAIATEDVWAALNTLLISVVIYVILGVFTLIVHIIAAYPLRPRLYYNLYLLRLIPRMEKIINSKSEGG